MNPTRTANHAQSRRPACHEATPLRWMRRRLGNGHDNEMRPIMIEGNPART